MKKKKNNTERNQRNKWSRKKIIILAIIIFTIVINIIYVPHPRTARYEVSGSAFEQFIKQGFIKNLEMRQAKNESGYIVYWDFEKNGKTETYSFFIERLERLRYDKVFEENNVAVEYVKESWGVFIASCIILISVIIIFVGNKLTQGNRRLARLKGVKHLRSEFSGLTGFGGGADSKTEDEKPKTKFKDVAGCDEAKAEVREVVEFLKNPDKFTRLGGKMPKGILLAGSPGTGKTLMARAMAGEADVPMLSKSGSDFIEKYVGVGAGRVRDLFDRAESKAPCIVFIDEAESIGKRGGAEARSSGESEEGRTINAMLTRMDGFKPNTGIVLVLATNRPDMLDKALIRPGRIDRQIVINKPDIKGREEILRVHARTRIMSPDKNKNLKYIAKITTGLVGADLENIINEAAIYAAKKGKEYIELSDLEYALEKVSSGSEQKSRVMSNDEKRRIAYHESGHTIVAEILPHALKPRKVSIMPRGLGVLGQTMLMPEEEKQLTTKDELIANISTLYGGRIAEEMIYGNCSTGSQNDQERATKIIKQMVCIFGMDETIGVRAFGSSQNSYLEGQGWQPSSDHSEETKKEIDNAIKKLTEDTYATAKKIITSKRDALETMTNRLMEKETLERKEIVEIIRNNKQLLFNFKLIKNPG